MTNEEKAFQFANLNCDAYENDEDPLCALRDGFLHGCEWKDKQFDETVEKIKEIVCDTVRDLAIDWGACFNYNYEDFMNYFKKCIDEQFTELLYESVGASC